MVGKRKWHIFQKAKQREKYSICAKRWQQAGAISFFMIAFTAKKTRRHPSE